MSELLLLSGRPPLEPVPDPVPVFEPVPEPVFDLLAITAALFTSDPRSGSRLIRLSVVSTSDFLTGSMVRMTGEAGLPDVEVAVGADGTVTVTIVVGRGTVELVDVADTTVFVVGVGSEAAEVVEERETEETDTGVVMTLDDGAFCSALTCCL